MRILSLGLAWAMITASDSGGSALDSLVAAERAFAALSLERGTRTAFLTWLAPNATVFAPGPVHAHAFWTARPESKSRLIWEPAYAEVSADGDLGVSLGPWEFRPSDADTAAAHGHFISVWARENDGPWRVAVDLGISHERLKTGVGTVSFQPGPVHPPKANAENRSGYALGSRVSRSGLDLGLGLGSYLAPRWSVSRSNAHARHRMMSAERTHAFVLRRLRPAEALRSIAADDVRVFRNGVPPAIGIEDAVQIVEGDEGRVQWMPSGSAISQSLDLGYSFGLARRQARGAGKSDTSAYLHVWRNLDGKKWKLVIDVENAFPKR